MEKKERLYFVIMPFKGELKEVYLKAIKPACNEAGFKPLRVDEVPGIYNINRKIVEYLYNSEVIIADLTDWNPNVFYELGVAHSIDNKTIPIIRNGQDIPFDVKTYTCVIYEQSDAGMAELKNRLAPLLLSFEHWRGHPTNPVQDYKPHDAFVPREKLEELQSQLRKTDEQLKNSVSREEYQKLRREYEKLRRQLEAAQKQLSERVSPSRLAEVERELAATSAELARTLTELETQKPAPVSRPVVPVNLLRSQPVENLSEEAVQKMLAELDFYDSRWNKMGKGFPNRFEKQQNGQVVYDHASGLLWQQAGSPGTMDYEDAKKYIDKLNQEKFAGHGDWRLPTLEEAMSLVKPEKNADGLYIDPVFDANQVWIWTADRKSASVAWVVDFDLGYCNDGRLGFNTTCYVRAVCFGHRIFGYSPKG